MDEIWIEMDCAAEMPHLHTSLEILYVLSGNATVMTSRSTIALDTEDFIVLNPWENHWLSTRKGTHTISFYISSDFIQKHKIDTINCCSRLQPERAGYLVVMRGLLAALYRTIMDDPTENRLYAMSYLFRLAALLNQEFSAGSPLELKDSEIQRLQNVLEYIAQHYTEPISLEDVAKHIFLSSGYISKKFQSHMGVSFSEYLRTLRLQRAAQLLSETKQSIGEIALNCGFSNLNTFILNFKNEFQCTPRVFRQQAPVWHSEAVEEESLSIMRLLKYADQGAPSWETGGQQVEHIGLSVDINERLGVFRPCHRELMRVGMAVSLLQENVRDAVRMAQRDIGFRYVTFYGLLSDTMGVYHEDQDGIPWYSFTQVDAVLDFVLEVGLKPLLMLCFTPAKLCENGKNSNAPMLPADLAKWASLIRALIHHLKDRYGEDEISCWRYAPMTAIYVHYGKFSLNNYFEYYQVTVFAVRDCLPNACIVGCTLDTGFISQEKGDSLIKFLRYGEAHNCLPDIFSFQCLQCDYGRQTVDSIEGKIIDAHRRDADEPAFVSADPNILKKELQMVRDILDTNGGVGKPILLFGWSSTIWEGDLSNDTCFKAACIVKNYLENMDNLCAAAYVNLTDNYVRNILFSNTFYGGFGLCTYQGLPKAGYYAYQLLNHMEGILIKRGNGYAVTRTENKKSIHIMLYHYCHYDVDKRITHAQTVAEKQTIDRYAEFQDQGKRSIKLHLCGLLQGSYQKQIFTISRKSGSSYDKWMEMGAPATLKREELSYLSKVSLPEQHFQQIHVDETGELLLSALLSPHEVQLITLEKA